MYYGNQLFTMNLISNFFIVNPKAIHLNNSSRVLSPVFFFI